MIGPPDTPYTRDTDPEERSQVSQHGHKLGNWTPPPKDPDWADVEQSEERRFLDLLEAVASYGVSLMNRAGYFECRLCHRELGIDHEYGCPVGYLAGWLAIAHANERDESQGPAEDGRT